MPDRPFLAVKALVHNVERVAKEKPDPTLILAEAICRIAASDADPYLVLGVLIEGAAHTLAASIPLEGQADTVAALVQLWRDRLRVHGAT
jgi:hypothetical protein